MLFFRCSSTGLEEPGHNFSRGLASYPGGASQPCFVSALPSPFSPSCSRGLLPPWANAQPAPSRQPLTGSRQGFEVLGQRAAFHTDFTFDRSMLQLAGYFIGDADQEARNAIAKLNGISVHSYHFAAPGLYDPAALDLIRRQYEAAGWTASGRGSWQG